MADNPFLDSSFNIRWSQLTPECVVPAIEEALGRAQANIDVISGRAPDTLTYQNTLLALEHATEELTLVWAKLSPLQSVADSPALREAHNAMLPKVSALFASIPLNAALWTRIKTFA